MVLLFFNFIFILVISNRFNFQWTNVFWNLSRQKHGSCRKQQKNFISFENLSLAIYCLLYEVDVGLNFISQRKLSLVLVKRFFALSQLF